MGSKAEYSLKWEKGWQDWPLEIVDEAMGRVSERILRQAKSNAPFLTGRLRASGQSRQVGDLETAVSFGNRNVPYAVRRHFENRKNPHTRYYLSNAAKTVSSQAKGEWMQRKL